MANPQPNPSPQQRPESYTRPLLWTVLVTLAQVLIPARYRIGPPSLVPIAEGVALVGGLVIAAKPGPVPQRARPFMLGLFGLLVTANTGAAVRLVLLVLHDGKVDGERLTASRLLIAGVLVLATNVVTFGLVYWQLDGGGPGGRVSLQPPYPDFLFPQTSTPGVGGPELETPLR